MAKTAKNTKGKNEKVRKERKSKAKKDKNAPKRAISAFFFYQKTRRETLKVEQPQLDNKQLISTMSQEWTKMNDTQKIPYAKLAEEDKARYAREKKEYEKTKLGSVAKPQSVKKAPTSSAKRKVSADSNAADEDDDE